MSIRTAIAGALVKTGLLTEEDMYQPRGLLIVDEIAAAIITDSHVNENAELPGLWAMVRNAIEPSTTPPNEVIYRLREQGVVIAVDQQAVNFGTRPR